MSLYLVHVPKTGGKSIRRSLGRHLLPSTRELELLGDVRPHKFAYSGVQCRTTNGRSRTMGSYAPLITAAREYCLLGLVRNPISWFVSYCSHNGFSGWSDNNLVLGTKDLNELARIYCDQDSAWNIQHLKHCMLSQFFDGNGQCVVDYVVPIENMAQFLEYLSAASSRRLTSTHTNVSASHGQELTNWSRRRLEETFSPICELFGYAGPIWSPERALAPFDGIGFELSGARLGADGRIDLARASGQTEGLARLVQAVLDDGTKVPVTA